MKKALPLLLLLASCRYHAPYALVTVAVAPGAGAIAQLHVVASFNGSSQELFLPSSASAPLNFPTRFSLQLPSGSHGDLGVLVEGRDAAGKTLAQNSGSLPIDGDGEYDLSLTLGAVALDGGTDAAPMPVWSARTISSKILLNVWGSGPNDIYVVGYSGLILHSTDGGTGWQQEGPVTAQNLTNIWGSSSGDIWVVGFGGTLLHSTGNGTWVALTNSPTTNLLLGVWGTAQNDVYAAGAGGTLLHFDGTNWSKSTTIGYSGDLFAVWGSSADDVLTVGGTNGTSPGAILQTKNRGATWTPLTSNVTGVLRNIWGSGVNDVYAVGDSGAIVHSGDDATWQPQTSPVQLQLNTNWGKNGNLFIVGNGGVVLNSSDSGAHWTQQDSFTTVPLYGIWGSAPNDVFAVGEQGIIIHYH